MRLASSHLFLLFLSYSDSADDRERVRFLARSFFFACLSDDLERDRELRERLADLDLPLDSLLLFVLFTALPSTFCFESVFSSALLLELMDGT